MCALIYALNDSDERVRKEAADEIGDQLKKHPCCANCKVIAALTAALADCDRGVVRKAERALCIAGYDVKDCCNNTCGAVACSAPGATTEPTPAPAHNGHEAAPAPAPAPPTAATPEPETYFPSRLKNQQTKSSYRTSLSDLFGFLD